MFRPAIAYTVFLALALCSGCAPKPAQESAESADSEESALSITLDSSEYCGGEHDQHWHLTEWSLRNDSTQSVDEAVIMVSIFDADEVFLGHHAVTFGHLMPGEAEKKRRLLFLKSDNIGRWRAKCEAILSRDRGDMTEEYLVVSAAPAGNS